MKNKAHLVYLIIAVLNFAALLLVVLKLPDIVAIHANYNMQIDGYGSKWWILGFGLLPIALAFCGNLIERAVRGNEKVGKIAFGVILLFITALSWIGVLMAFLGMAPPEQTANIPLDSILILPIGLLLMVLSNFYGKLKRNPYFGIRIPATLRSDEVWRKAHRLGGYTGVIGGFLMCLGAGLSFLFKNPAFSLWGLGLGMVGVAVIPIVYALWLGHKEKISGAPIDKSPFDY